MKNKAIFGMEAMQLEEMWHVATRDVDTYVVDIDGHTIAKMYERVHADRTVACVNALVGLNPEAIPELIAACQAAERRLSHMSSGEAKLCRHALAKVKANKTAPTGQA